MTGRLLGLLGILVFLGLAAACSTDRRRIDRRAVLTGLLLQALLGLFVLRTPWGRGLFAAIGDAVQRLLAYSDAGARMVFGAAVIDEQALGFVFAFKVLPTVIFISALFTMLYHFGVLQLVVRAMAWVMMRIMRVSGAESLSSAANVFMGQTEAPLIVKPYLDKLTRSELMTLMVSGMATISGGVMAAYIGMGVDATALITASVMAAPGAMVIAKILHPEDGDPLTRGVVRVQIERTSANFVDALARGASEGLGLALNIAAMLIAFVALVALADGLLGLISPGITLGGLMAWAFLPVAWLIGVTGDAAHDVAGLLGTKLVLNEFVAYAQLAGEDLADLPERARILVTFALCGFANLSSVGIQLGGIGALAPSRRADLAALAFRALLGGFMASLLSASMAAILLP